MAVESTIALLLYARVRVTLRYPAGTSGGHRSSVPPTVVGYPKGVTSRLLQGGGYREMRLGSVYPTTHFLPAITLVSVSPRSVELCVVSVLPPPPMYC